MIAASALAAADSKPAESKQIDVDAANSWTDTGIDVQAGDKLTVTATGEVDFGPRASTPDGLPRGWTELVMQLPNNESGRGALLGRITNDAAARAFVLGAKAEKTAPISGRLFLGVNEPDYAKGKGTYHVTVERTPAAQSAPTSYNVPAFTQDMLDRIPLRVNDAMGNLGDRVNFIIIGSEEQVKAAFAAAGWVQVDKTKSGTVVEGLIATLSKEAYVTMPMSELELFNRVQDFGYAQGDPIRVVASRNHFRLWKAPFTDDGTAVWAGAGTHDIGFERDQRNNGVTHKIDPATDGERDYIGSSLKDTGMVAKEEYMTPSHPVKEARTATGGGFTSDGRTLIIWLKPAAE